MPLPSFATAMVPFSRLISTLMVVIVGSRCLLSAALTIISSKILKRPGTYVTGRRTMRLVDASRTHMGCVDCSMEPMYVSGRSRMCSSCVFFWYVSSIVLPPFFFGAAFLGLGASSIEKSSSSSEAAFFFLGAAFLGAAALGAGAFFFGGGLATTSMSSSSKSDSDSPPNSSESLSTTIFLVAFLRRGAAFVASAKTVAMFTC
mmetsp:Transcript_14134/g.43686  ORF Transcript_14134/g.43686 Transcript_14134/m.43686 type:complete len:203 (+) Transcript_14134:3217-3825(+)